METGFGKGCKGSEANGSPTRMEQGQNFQQAPPVPPSTLSSSSRHQQGAGCSPGLGVMGGGCGGSNVGGLAPGLLGLARPLVFRT